MQRDFFIGWDDVSKVDRRSFTALGLGLLTGGVALAHQLASKQAFGNPGRWNMGEVREWTGIVTAEPYAMLRTQDLDGTPRTVLLGCMGKCGVAARIGALEGELVQVTGSLIRRGDNTMLAVIDGMDWIKPVSKTDTALVNRLAFSAATPITEISLRGEILDTKCWFGAMSPAQGKVHKSCASLCIRGGIPPAFFAQDVSAQKLLMIMTDRGQGFGHDILAYVGDPISLRGMLLKQDELLYLDVSTAQFTRI